MAQAQLFSIPAGVSAVRDVNHMSASLQSIRGPVLALDLGEKRVGVALSDELLISIRRLTPIARSNWKKLLSDVAALIQSFDAQTVVIGLPLNLDGSQGPAASAAEEIARKFSLSLTVPVFLQDERLSSVEANERLRREGLDTDEIKRAIDSEAAVIVLRDFLAVTQDQDKAVFEG
jgi:putative Holliday junction resolvase